MDKRMIVGVAFALLVSIPHVFAKTPEKELISLPALGHPYFGVVAGASIAKIGVSQLDTGSGIINGFSQYTPTNSYRGAFLYGIDGGYEFNLGSTNGLLSLGLGIYQNTNYSSKGQVTYVYQPDPSLSSTLYNYEYKLQSTRLMFETQLAWQLYLGRHKVIPYVAAGVGPSLNFANNYQETVVSSKTLRGGFNSNYNVGFAYQLGLGVACPFNTEHDRLSLSYRYVDSGCAHFDSRKSHASAYRLDVGRIRSNEIYVGYTHLFK